MKREPRLQFSDADLAEPKLEKPIKRVKKAEAKADKAQAKIPKKTVVKKERGFDPATGKVKTQLRFEKVDKKKPPSKLTHAVQDAPASFVLSQVHREVRQSEDDNVGVEAAHKVEQAVESGGRLVQSAHRAHQLKPYRAAIRAEKKLERANLDALQKKAEIDSPTSNPVSKWQQKQAIKKQYAAAKHNQAAQTTAKAAENTAKAAKKAAEKAEEAARQLAEYRRPDGGYAHLPDGDTNRMATAQTLEAFTALALSQRGEGLFSALPAVSPGLSSQDGSADIDVSADSQIAGNPENGNTAEPVIPGTAQSSAAPEQTHGFTGTHIKLIVSAAAGLAAAGMLAAAIIRRKKLLIPGAVLLAAVCGGVWLLDIRTPSEYYAQEVTGGMEVTFSADCKSVLGRMDTIDPSVNQPSVIPPDGVVIAECTLSLPEGSSAFDALITAARQQQVRVDYTGSSWGTYVRSIGYISEFGFGELSGWMYRVNGEFPQVYAGEFTLHEGDVVEFVYTCDLGGDVGDSYNAENAG